MSASNTPMVALPVVDTYSGDLCVPRCVDLEVAPSGPGHGGGDLSRTITTQQRGMP